MADSGPQPLRLKGVYAIQSQQRFRIASCQNECLCHRKYRRRVSLDPALIYLDCLVPLPACPIPKRGVLGGRMVPKTRKCRTQPPGPPIYAAEGDTDHLQRLLVPQRMQAFSRLFKSLDRCCIITTQIG